MKLPQNITFQQIYPESKCAEAFMKISKDLSSHVQSSRTELNALETAVILSLVLLFIVILMATWQAMFPRRLHATQPVGPPAI